MFAPTSQASPFSMRAYDSARLTLPARTDLISVPVRAMPASNESSIEYSWRALRFWATVFSSPTSGSSGLTAGRPDIWRVAEGAISGAVEIAIGRRTHECRPRRTGIRFAYVTTRQGLFLERQLLDEVVQRVGKSFDTAHHLLSFSRMVSVPAQRRNRGSPGARGEAWGAALTGFGDQLGLGAGLPGAGCRLGPGSRSAPGWAKPWFRAGSPVRPGPRRARDPCPPEPRRSWRPRPASGPCPGSRPCRA